MDGEVAASTETAAPAAAVVQNATPDASDATQPVAENKPSGFEPVEFTPEQQERVNRLYGNMKRYETKAQQLEQANQILLERYNELNGTTQQIVSHIQSTDYQEAESTLRTQMKAAWDRGDLDGYHFANEKLLDVKTQKALADRDSRQKPQQKQQVEPNRAISATEALEISVQKGETPPDEANILRAYFSETDEGGLLKRPWVNAQDMRNTQAARIAAVVFDPNHPVFGAKPLRDKLTEIDRQMGVVNRAPSGQAVLGGGNLTRPVKANKVELSQTERDIALKTRFAATNPKLTPQQKAALTDADHLEAYKQAKVKHQAKRSR